MRILLTGNKGFVGSHIETVLKKEHEIVGLDRRGGFGQWCEDMYAVMDTGIDAIIHAGAISNNQSHDPDIYLWNSYATLLLVQRASDGGADRPFIFISTLLVEETQSRWEERSPYCWSKVLCETFVYDHLPCATVLRPAVVWGDERNKQTSGGSVPFQLANHSLEYLFENYTRRYVHASDMAKAVKNCLDYKHQGVYSVTSDMFWPNNELARLIEWDNYEQVGDPREVGFPHIITHREKLHAPRVPGWLPEVDVKDELLKLERLLCE